jgi:RNA polymerase sigma-70 factor (ECF subfamily)
VLARRALDTNPRTMRIFPAWHPSCSDVAGVDAASRNYSRLLRQGADLTEVESLRRGNEVAFRSLVERHTPTLLRVASALVRDRALAEEVVQQTWLEVLENVDGFEARSTVKTWLCGICINTARARMRRERRTVPMSSLSEENAGAQAAVDPSRFFPPDSHWAGHWYVFPKAWPETPEDSAWSAEIKARLLAAIEALPDAQRQILVLRDVEGLSGEEACNVLGLSDTNQRVLLHRARAKLRGLLEDLFDPPRPS